MSKVRFIREDSEDLIKRVKKEKPERICIALVNGKVSMCEGNTVEEYRKFMDFSVPEFFGVEGKVEDINDLYKSINSEGYKKLGDYTYYTVNNKITYARKLGFIPTE